MKTAAIYVRVSTADQHVESQLYDLRELAKQRGFHVAKEYEDRGVSGSKARRPGLDALMADARRKRFDVVLVAAFDRLARSTKHFLEVIDELNALEIEFISAREGIDTLAKHLDRTLSGAAKSPYIAFLAYPSCHSLLVEEAIQNGGWNPQHSIAPFVKAFGRSQINHAGFFLETTADHIRADFEHLGDFTHREKFLLLHGNVPFRISRLHPVHHSLTLPQRPQTDKPDLPPILRQDRLARERNLSENSRLVAHREFPEAAQLQREPVCSQIIEQSGFKRRDHGVNDHLRFFLGWKRQRLLNPQN
jgi:hypothetical protein